MNKVEATTIKMMTNTDSYLQKRGSLLSVQNRNKIFAESITFF